MVRTISRFLISSFVLGLFIVPMNGVAQTLTPKQADEVMQSVPKAVRTNYFGPSNTAIEMNFKSPLFKDLRVRQAVNMVMDRKAHIAALAGGAGAITGTFPFARFPEYALADDEISKLKIGRAHV